MVEKEGRLGKEPERLEQAGADGSTDGAARHERLACLDLVAFPLQLVHVDRPDWRGRPAVAVEHDGPQSPVTHANDAARAAGVAVGMRYGVALGLCTELAAGVVDGPRVASGVATVLAVLQRFSPLVQPKEDEPGVFWVHGRGLGRLYGGPKAWADAMLGALGASGFAARLAVGFDGFSTYAAAKGLAKEKPLVFRSPEEERVCIQGVPIAALHLPPQVRDRLHRLGIQSAGEFATLPAGGVLERFGPEVFHLQRLASGARRAEFCAAKEELPLAAEVHLDDPEARLEGLLHHVGELAAPMLAGLARSAQAARALLVELHLERGGLRAERLVPGEPTCDLVWLLRLLAMRLEAAVLTAGAERIRVELEPTAAPAHQGALFLQHHARHPAALAKVLGALTAALGPDAVVRAASTSAHLPERSYRWERLVDLPRARPRPETLPPLVRLQLDPPVDLPPRPRHGTDGWLAGGLGRGPVVRLVGPYLLSGGWWGREVRREYHLAELQTGEVLWLYYDAERRTWHCQGRVT